MFNWFYLLVLHLYLLKLLPTKQRNEPSNTLGPNDVKITCIFLENRKKSVVLSQSYRHTDETINRYQFDLQVNYYTSHRIIRCLNHDLYRI
jgi:hypothetical protein